MPLLRPISVRWRRCYFAAFSACAYFSVKTRKSLLRCQQHQTSHEKQGKGDAVLSSRRSVYHYAEGCSSLFFVIMRIREMRVACSSAAWCWEWECTLVHVVWSKLAWISNSSVVHRMLLLLLQVGHLYAWNVKGDGWVRTTFPESYSSIVCKQ